jgi:hypothetical protein
MAERSYTRALGETARKRHIHTTERGKVVDFVVQLEVNIDNEWKPVLRYDCAHDFSHIDRYNIHGEQKKEDLRLPYDEALTIADEDINMHWQAYVEQFLRGEFP